MLPIPASGKINLFSTGFKHVADSTIKFNMTLVDVHAPPGILRVNETYFDLIVKPTTPAQADLVLTRSIAGPQEIELDFNIKIYHNTTFARSVVTKLFIYVSQ